MPTIQVVGYGTLLSEASARRTAPSVARFRVVRVPGYLKVFNKVSPAWRARYDGKDPLAIAVLAARERAGASFLGTAFEVDEQDFLALFEREHHYRWVEVACNEDDGSATTGRMCAEWTDADYRLNRCVTEAEYERRIGRHYDGVLWRDDVLPSPPYLEACLEAARTLGREVYEDFGRTTFLADGRTTIRAWLANGGAAAASEAPGREPRS